MIEKRKQELRQLLDEAMDNMEVRIRSGDTQLPSVDIGRYKWHLKESLEQLDTRLSFHLTFAPTKGKLNAYS